MKDGKIAGLYLAVLVAATILATAFLLFIHYALGGA